MKGLTLAAVLLNDRNILIAGEGTGGSISYVNAEIYYATTRTLQLLDQ